MSAIGTVAFLKVVGINGTVNVSFVNGESKLAPKGATSIVRLELCAAVLATEMGQRINLQLRKKPDATYYYSDSRVVLAYLTNTDKHFARYVQRRTDIVRNATDIADWSFIEGSCNPADFATKPTSPAKLRNSAWLNGPVCLHANTAILPAVEDESLNGLELPEVEPDRSVTLKSMNHESFLAPLFSEPKRWFTSWASLIELVGALIGLARTWKSRIRRKDEEKSLGEEHEELRARDLLIKTMQAESFPELLRGKNINPRHKLATLCPFRDDKDMIRRKSQYHS